jgi:hypothetical protein
MRKKHFLIPVVFSFLFSSFVFAQTPDIEGTYEFVIRVLPDGTRINAPDIVGLMIFTETHKTSSLMVNKKDGEQFSYSVVSTYNLENSEYTETNIISVINDKTMNEQAAAISDQSASVPIIKTEGKFEINMPFEPVTAVFDGDRVVTKAKDGTFTDYWKKIKE